MLHLEPFSPKHILVVRSLPGIGDLLCSVPVLRALRAAFPKARIAVMGLANQRWFRDRFTHFVDDWVEFAGYPGIPEGWRGVGHLPEFLAAQQHSAYDLALQLHGNGRYMNPFVTMLGARVTAGFFVPGHFCPDPQSFFPYPDGEPEIWRLLRLLERLQIPLQGDDLEFPLQSADATAYRRLAESHGLRPASYVCIHPGASVGDRRWSAASFAAIANTLAQQGYTVVLTGTAAERPLTERVAAQMTLPPINLAGKTELGTLAALLHDAALLICNDTGVSHLAAATKTPSVVIFSKSEVHRWAPLDRDRHRVIDLRTIEGDPIDAVLVEATTLLAQGSRVVGEELVYVG